MHVQENWMPKEITILLYFGLTLCKKRPRKLWLEDTNEDQRLIAPAGLTCCGAGAGQAQAETRGLWGDFSPQKTTATHAAVSLGMQTAEVLLE